MSDSDDSETNIIIAPGGFRIQRPHPIGDGGAVNLGTFDQLLPEVRQGLSLLPPLPTLVIELLKETQSSSSTASSVADIAASDPTLAASLLRAVNSAAFGLSQKVTSVSQAVSLLGFGAVRSLVVRLPPRRHDAAAFPGIRRHFRRHLDPLPGRLLHRRRTRLTHARCRPRIRFHPRLAS